MPLADETAVANLALDHIGEPYLDDLTTDTGETAECVRLHFSQAVETVLEGHVWSFAARFSRLISASLASTPASVTLDPTGSDNAMTFTAVTPGPSGNDIVVEIHEPPTDIPYGTIPWGYPLVNDGIELVVSGTRLDITPRDFIAVSGTLTLDDGSAVTFPKLFAVGIVAAGGPKERYTSTGIIVPGTGGLFELYYAGGQWVLRYQSPTQVTLGRWFFVTSEESPDGLVLESQSPSTGNATLSLETFTAAEVVAAVMADAASAALLTAETVDEGTGQVGPVTGQMAGGDPGTSIFAPAWGSAFNLPSDCLRLVAIDGCSVDAPRRRFELLGRHLLLEAADEESPVVRYITNSPPVDEWPTTFTDAVAYLLASRIAPKLAQNSGLAAELMQKHDLALGKARSKDARETRSAENFGPRQLAARSGLVAARHHRRLFRGPQPDAPES